MCGELSYAENTAPEKAGESGDVCDFCQGILSGVWQGSTSTG